MNNHDLKDLRYRLYARKSTDTEDKQIQSLDNQVEYMTKLAKDYGLHIVGDPICESKSAKQPFNRPLFSELLKEIEEGKIDGIICWKVDRLSRNPTESGYLQQLLQDEKLKHILAMDRNYYPEDNSIVFSVDAAQSNEYVRKLAVDTRRGVSEKARLGGFGGTPPIGYLNDTINKTIIPDPDRFGLVRVLWDKMLTGTYSIAQLTKVANEELHIVSVRRKKIGGNPIAYSTLCTMFKNPFYTGRLRFHDSVLPGKHQAMVTDEEFEKVQTIIDPSHTTRPKNKLYDFQFRNLFKCGECGFAITVEKKTKELKSTGEEKEYIYYHCTGKSKRVKCSQPGMNVTEEELIRQLQERLSAFTIDSDFYKLAIEALAQEEDEVVAKDSAKTHAIELAIKKATTAIENLRRMRYNGEADDDSWYFAEMNTLEAGLAKLQDQRNFTEYKARDWRAYADETFTFARYAKEDFDSDDLEKKRSVIMRLGQELTILDRTIQFTPNKYFIPLEKMNESKLQLSKMVRTDSQQREIGSNSIEITSWLRRLDSNQRPRS